MISQRIQRIQHAQGTLRYQVAGQTMMCDYQMVRGTTTTIVEVMLPADPCVGNGPVQHSTHLEALVGEVLEQLDIPAAHLMLVERIPGPDATPEQESYLSHVFVCHMHPSSDDEHEGEQRRMAIRYSRWARLERERMEMYRANPDWRDFLFAFAM